VFTDHLVYLRHLLVGFGGFATLFTIGTVGSILSEKPGSWQCLLSSFQPEIHLFAS